MFFVGFGSNITAYAAVNDTVFLAPTSQTSVYFNSSISDGSILLTCKSTVTTATPWEIVISPPLSYAESDGDYYITFVNYRSYNPDVIFYNANGTVINALSTKQISIDSVSYDTNAFVYKLPKTLAYIKVGGGGAGTLAVNQTVFMSAYFQPAGSEQSNDDIIAAIQNQTSDILSKLDNQTQEITGAIEDQYSGDPEQSFNVDDIVTQHNEKMGVLSFSSDVMMDVLGLFSPNQTLTSELVFPSMSLTIAGQRNKVQLWPEYRFDLEELRQHWPTFINLMRTITTASVWLLVLRYCYKVFEKYFLAGGSS